MRDAGIPDSSDADLGGRSHLSLATRLRARLTVDHALVFLLVPLVLVVHDVGYMLSQPYWADESWVAATARFPLTQLPDVTSATPIGWSFLVRVFSLAGAQTGRLEPLAFAAGAVAAAYWFARGLDWPSRELAVVSGLLAGAAALLTPAMLVRNDLKQYTADACFALLILALTSRLERHWSRRGLTALSVSVWGGMLFSHTAAFVGVAVFSAVVLVQLVRRAWLRTAEAAVAGIATAVVMFAVYEAFDARTVRPSLTAYWHGYYAPLHSGVPASVRFVTSRFDAVEKYFGLGPTWMVAALFVLGLIAIFRLGRPATAVALAALWPELAAVSAAKRYPFLDLRTSTYLIVTTAVVAAIGAVGLGSVLRRMAGRVVAAVLVVVALTAFAIQAHPYVRYHSIPSAGEDARDQIYYVAAHAASDDVILVNLMSAWNFAYYWPTGHPSREPNAFAAQGYQPYFPDQPRIVVATGRDTEDIETAFDAALVKARQGPEARIWLVRAHATPGEQAAWASTLRTAKVTATPVGSNGLSVISLGEEHAGH